jgi:hypothetical protein
MDVEASIPATNPLRACSRSSPSATPGPKPTSRTRLSAYTDKRPTIQRLIGVLPCLMMRAASWPKGPRGRANWPAKARCRRWITDRILRHRAYKGATLSGNSTSGLMRDDGDRLQLDRKGADVPALHIEHPISDLGTWLEAFRGFADARRDSGVTAERVHQPVGDENYIVVELDFPTVDAAARFKAFLESVVWQSQELSPGLAGTPQARVLREVDPRA